MAKAKKQQKGPEANVAAALERTHQAALQLDRDHGILETAVSSLTEQVEELQEELAEAIARHAHELAALREKLGGQVAALERHNRDLTSRLHAVAGEINRPLTT